MAYRVKDSTILMFTKRSYSIYLDEDALVIPRVGCGWEEFIKKVDKLYNKYTASIDGKALSIETIEKE